MSAIPRATPLKSRGGDVKRYENMFVFFKGGGIKRTIILWGGDRTMYHSTYVYHEQN